MNSFLLTSLIKIIYKGDNSFASSPSKNLHSIFAKRSTKIIVYAKFFCCKLPPAITKTTASKHPRRIQINRTRLYRWDTRRMCNFQRPDNVSGMNGRGKKDAWGWKAPWFTAATKSCSKKRGDDHRLGGQVFRASLIHWQIRIEKREKRIPRSLHAATRALLHDSSLGLEPQITSTALLSGDSRQ